jgi:hypothetical protein
MDDELESTARNGITRTQATSMLRAGLLPQIFERPMAVGSLKRAIIVIDLLQFIYTLVALFCFSYSHRCERYAIAQLVGALCCKPEGRGFDFRWDLYDFLLT